MRMKASGVAVLLVAGLVASGCGHVNQSAQDYAKSACDAYNETGRVQVATTLDESAAIRDVARSDANAAAAFDPRFESLSSDMRSALGMQEAMRGLSDTRLAHYFAVDRQVQTECSDAGRDIGDLKP